MKPALIGTLGAVAMLSAAAVAHPPVKPQKGMASFYKSSEAGHKTASGRPLRLDHMTAASRTLPLGTRAKVTNTDTGRSAEVTITDRGPHAKGRVLDVTPKAAASIGLDKKDGVAPVEVKPVALPDGTPAG